MYQLSELLILLKTAKSVEQIDEQRNKIVELIPRVSIMFGYDQQNSAHQYDLWFHSLHTVINIPRNLDDDMLYLAALLHDIGKPDTQCNGKRIDDLNKHYYGHPKRSGEIVRNDVIPYLDKHGMQISFFDIKRLLYYIEHHDDLISYKIKSFRVHQKIASIEEFHNLMLLEIADANAHVMIPIIKERIDICTDFLDDKVNEMYHRILSGE